MSGSETIASTAPGSLPDIYRAAALPGSALPSLPSDAADGDLIHRLDWQGQREPLLLRAAGIAAVQELAGKELPAVSVGLIPFVGEEPQMLSPRAMRCLDLILAENIPFRELLEEWLLHAMRTQRRPSPEMIPILVEAVIGPSSRALRPLVTQVIGARGQWFAQATGAEYISWITRTSDLPADHGSLRELFETGTREERKRALAAIRASDPALARELATDVWAAESWEVKLAILNAFSENPSIEEEPLFENALNDRRSEVRVQAAKLLLQIPGSALCRRIQDRTLPLFAMKKVLLISEKLEISLPQECDLAMQRDGLIAKAPTGLGIGDRAFWLQQLTARTRSAALCAALRTSPSSLISLAYKTEFAQALITGFREAAVRFKDRQMAVELLKFALTGDAQLKAVGGIESLSLSSMLPAAELGSLAVQTMGSGSLTAGTSLAFEAAKLPDVWDQKFTSAVVSMLKTAMRDVPTQSVRAYQCRDLLTQAAMKAPPIYAGAFENLLPTDGPLPDGDAFWRKSLNSFNEIMQFRSEMAAAFADIS
jgi:Family of unknown function (DUF5691)